MKEASAREVSTTLRSSTRTSCGEEDEKDDDEDDDDGLVALTSEVGRP
jgi:hypothetical protein